jgi:hypothetical protein
MEINIRGEAFSSGAGPQTLFHEMLHWLNYKHNEGVDITYLTTVCCFNPTEYEYQRDARQSACGLLGRNLDWTGAEYQRLFARIMALDSRPQIALNSGYSAMHAAPLLIPHPPDHHNAIGLYEATKVLMNEDRRLWQERNRTEGRPLLGVILGQAALINLQHEPGYPMIQDFHEHILSAYPENNAELRKIRELGTTFGKLLNATMNGQGATFKAAWHYFTEAQAQACPLLNANEKQQLRDAYGMAAVDFWHTEPSISTYHDVFSNPCP